MKIYKVLHLFAGIGGGALGFERARAEALGLAGRYRTVGAVDVDAAACRDFERLVGRPATCADVSKMTPAALLEACGGEAPDVVFTSPPCKGFSGLLSTAQSRTPKYQALNQLVLQGLWLVLETFGPDHLPRLILLENVPRIQQRGADLLAQVKDLLRQYGYRWDDSTHDCGELGGLAQHRRRFLLAARHEATTPVLVYRPPVQRVRAVGEVLEQLPLPDAPEAGPMHRTPRLKWKTWVRLALVPAGGDWRALGTTQDGEPWRGAYAVVPWEGPVGTVTGNGRPGGTGAGAVADPRGPAAYRNLYRVEDWKEPGHTVTGAARVMGGAPSVADPRLSCAPRSGVYGVVPWDGPASTVTGSADVHASAAAVADPRGPRFNNVYRVVRWEDASVAVTGGGTPTSGGVCVADPRIEGRGSRPDLFGVLAWDGPAKTVTGSASVSGSNSPAAVADPRIPGPDEQPDPPPVIIAEDGTWHRPLTTLELAALQSFPTRLADGSPLMLDGQSHTAWRERIGNAVPPDAAQAMAEAFLKALLQADAGATFVLGSGGAWVADEEAR